MIDSVTRLILVSMLMTLLASSGGAQVTVLATGSGKTAGNTYTAADLGGFVPPAGTDKLVVLYHEEGGTPSSVTYAGAPLSRAITQGGGHPVAVFYLDYDASPTLGNLVFNRPSHAVSILALQGTADGYASSKGYSSPSGSPPSVSVAFESLFDGSTVAVGMTANGNGPYTGNADAPMTTLFVGSDSDTTFGISGYATNVTSGTNIYSFSSVVHAGAVAAVEFAALGTDVISPRITSTTAIDDGGNSTNSMSTDPVLNFNFDEAIFPGNGSILLKDSSGTLVESFNVTNSPKLNFNVSILSITPDILTPDTSYFVQIPTGAILDGSGNTTNYPDNALTITTGPWLTVNAENKTSYSTTDLREFDPTGYDKLVVLAMAESSAPSSLSWGSSNLTRITTSVNGAQRVSMWYVDGPFVGAQSLSINTSAVGLSLLALQGVEPGVVAFTNASGTSASFTTTEDESIVVAGFNANGTSYAYGDVPLSTYFSRPTNNGSSQGASAVTANSIIGPQIFSFSGNSQSPAIAIAEFLVTPPPAGTLITLN